MREKIVICILSCFIDMLELSRQLLAVFLANDYHYTPVKIVIFLAKHQRNCNIHVMFLWSNIFQTPYITVWKTLKTTPWAKPDFGVKNADLEEKSLNTGNCRLHVYLNNIWNNIFCENWTYEYLGVIKRLLPASPSTSDKRVFQIHQLSEFLFYLE